MRTALELVSQSFYPIRLQDARTAIAKVPRNRTQILLRESKKSDQLLLLHGMARRHGCLQELA